MKPVVFVSHSSSDRARAEALVQALEAGDALRTTFDVRDLRAGEAWQPQLYKWMARCHAGVVLVTAEVMKRPAWVLQEATLLRARAMLEGASFRLFVVIDRDVLDSATWKRWFHPLALPQLQMLVLDGPGADIAPAVAAIGAAVVHPRDGEGHFARLRRMVQDALRKPLENHAVQVLLDEGFALADADWLRLVGDDTQVDGRIAQRLCEGGFGAFSDLGGLLNALQGHCELPERQRLLDVLRSYWVPQILAARLAEAAGRLRPGVAAPEVPPNVVLVQAGAERALDVADMHRERQFMPYGSLGLLDPLPDAVGSEDALERDLAALFGIDTAGADGDAQRAEVLAEIDTLRRRPRPEYRFVQLEATATPEPLFTVARRWWCVVFIVTAAGPLHDEWLQHLGLDAPELPGGALDVAARLRELARAQRYVTPPRRATHR